VVVSAVTVDDVVVVDAVLVVAPAVLTGTADVVCVGLDPPHAATASAHRITTIVTRIALSS
jgi:hypothetical protein